MLVLRRNREIASTNTEVSASAAGNVSQIPSIPNKEERRYARGMININPRSREMEKEYFGCSIQLNFTAEMILMPAKRNPVKYS